jgi:hypothetical protein
VLVAQDVELLEPPTVGRPVTDLALAGDRGTPGGQFGGALDEDEAGMMLCGVVQDAVGGGPVLFGAGDTRVEVGVFQVEERQALLVGFLVLA